MPGSKTRRCTRIGSPADQLRQAAGTYQTRAAAGYRQPAVTGTRD